MVRPRIGVLALQGGVAEHLRCLEAGGAEPVAVRRPEELRDLQGIVLPGGESTTIDKLSRIFEIREPLIEQLRAGLPAYGSCAGMILLADRVQAGTVDQQTFGGLDVTVVRNAFGRQVDSFEAMIDIDLGRDDEPPFPAVFIRAPRVAQTGPAVQVLARVDDAIVAVRQDHLLATSFHPELTGDPRLHSYFVSMAAAVGAAA
jgi:5'-phosphate synthase pdxT subunit